MNDPIRWMLLHCLRVLIAMGIGFGFGTWLFGAAITPALKTTSLTRQLLTNATELGARTTIGIVNSNWAVNTDQFTAGVGEQLNAKAGMTLTNAYVTNAALVGYISNNASFPLFIQGFSNALTRYVSPSGDNATATLGRPDRPYATASNALAAAQAGETVVIMPGLYLSSISRLYTAEDQSAILLSNKSDIRVYGMPGSILSNSMQGSYFTIDRCKNILVEGLTIKGYVELDKTKTTNILTYGNFGGIEFVNSTNITIKNCRILNVTDHGILDGPNAKAVTKNMNIVIKDNYIENTGHWVYDILGYAYDGSGIVPGGDNALVEGNIIVGCRQNGIEIYPSPVTTAVCTNMVIRNNMLVNCNGGITTSWAGAGGPIRNLQIINNEILFEPTFKFEGTNNPDTIGVRTMAIGLPKCDGVIVENNHIAGMFYGIGAQVASALENIMIKGNTVRYTSAGAFFFDLSAVLRFAHFHNNVVEMIGGHALDSGTSDFRDGTILNNVFINMRTNSVDGRGMWLRTASNIVVTGNVIMDTQAPPTTTDGIYIDTGINVSSWDNHTFGIATPVTGVTWSKVEFIPGSISLSMTNATPPTHTAPNGSICLSTASDGEMWFRTNNAWIQK